MNILYATDDKFVPVMGVSITSLFEKNKDLAEINVYVAGVDISHINIQSLYGLAEQYGRNIILVDASDIDAYLSDAGVKEWCGGKSAWYRCFVERILPSEVSTVLYIDCDTIILDSLREEAQMELESGKAIAMAAQRSEGGAEQRVSWLIRKRSLLSVWCDSI